MLTAISTGVQLDVVESGDRSSPALLLICGTAQHHLTWGALAAALAERYHVISYNHRGVGDSLRGAGPLTTASMAQDAAAVLDAVGVSEAHVLGWSMGSLVAQELALACPDRVASLVLWGSFPAPDAYQACALAALSHPWRTGDMPTALAVFGLVFSQELLNSPEFSVLMEQMMPLLPQTESQVNTVVEQWDADLAHNAADRLCSISKPTLVIGAEQDFVAPPRQCRELAELIPGATLKIFTGPHSSHAVGLERTEEFLGEVLAFLSAQPAPTAAS